MTSAADTESTNAATHSSSPITPAQTSFSTSAQPSAVIAPTSPTVSDPLTSASPTATGSPSASSIRSSPPTPEVPSPTSQLSSQAPSAAELALSSSSLAFIQSNPEFRENSPSTSIPSSVISSSTTPSHDVSPSQAPSSSAAITSPSSAPVQLVAPISGEFASVTASSSSVAKPSGVQYPNADQGNVPMATGFNTIFKKLDVTSTCNANDANQAVACIEGELAQCQADGTYVLKSCPQGQSCYALPKPSGASGISVECAVPSDAVAKLSTESSTGNNGAAASQGSSPPQNSVAVASQAPSISQNTENQASSAAIATTSPIDGKQAQSATPVKTSSQAAFPLTESVKMPVEQISSVSLTPGILKTQAATPTTPTSASSSGNAQNQPPQSQTQQEVSTMTSPSETASASAASQPIQRPVESLQSLPSTHPNVNSQQATISAVNTAKSVPAQTQIAQAAQQSNTSPTTAAASNTADADGGALFSIPDIQPSSTPNPKPDTQPAQAQAQVNHPSSQETSTALPGQGPAATQSSASPAAHIPQPIPALAQATAGSDGGKSSATASADDAGITIVPLGGGSSHAPDTNANEKIVVPHSGGTPIYITVTVTTTAYTQAPST